MSECNNSSCTVAPGSWNESNSWAEDCRVLAASTRTWSTLVTEPVNSLSRTFKRWGLFLGCADSVRVMCLMHVCIMTMTPKRHSLHAFFLFLVERQLTRSAHRLPLEDYSRYDTFHYSGNAPSIRTWIPHKNKTHTGATESWLAFCCEFCRSLICLMLLKCEPKTKCFIAEAKSNSDKHFYGRWCMKRAPSTHS